MFYKPPKIIRTDEYYHFVEYEFNRDLRNLDDLRWAMKKYGFDEGCPLNCRRTNADKFLIVQGHHRFKVAKELSLPVTAVVSESTIPIEILEQINRHWSVKDFSKGHSRQGNEDYEILIEFSEKYHLPISNAVSLLRGYHTSGKAEAKMLKNGDFTVRNLEYAELVGDLTEHAKKCGVDFAKQRNFVRALGACCRVEQFDVKRWKKKLESHKQLMERQPTIGRYLEAIQLIYNRQCKEGNKINLAWLAQHLNSGVE